MDTINIYNPNEFPFGPLSITALHPMRVNGELYNTVENYILSNMLLTPLYRNRLRTAPMKGSKRETKIDEKVAQLIANTEVRIRRRLTDTEREEVRQAALDEVAMEKMDLKNRFNYYLGQEEVDQRRVAVLKAYTAKVADSPELAKALLATGTQPIQYVSDNDILGMGSDGNGLNLIGYTLMQIRQSLYIQQRSDTELSEQRLFENFIVDVYRARVILMRRLENSRYLLKEYIGMSPFDIVRDYIEEQSRNMGTTRNLEEQILDQIGIGESINDAVIKMYQRGQLPEVDRERTTPGYVVLSVRQKGLPVLQARLEKERDDLIVRLYTEDILRQTFPNETPERLREAAKQLEIAAPDADSYRQVKTVIIRQYTQNNLSPELTESIRQELAKIPLITQTELEKAREMRVPERVEVKESSSSSESYNPIKGLLSEDDQKTRQSQLIEQLRKVMPTLSIAAAKRLTIEQLERRIQEFGQKIEEKESEEQVVKIYAEVAKNRPQLEELSPLFEKSFTVDGFRYPNVAIYITVMLLTQTGVIRDPKDKTVFRRGTSIKKARELLMSQGDRFVSPNRANQIYENQKYISFRELMETYTLIGLRKKLEDIELAQLLDLTGDAELVYKDKDDILLGTGTKESPGENIVGKMLMLIRREIHRAPEQYNLMVGLPRNLEELIRSDRFVYEWIKMRIGDMCSVVDKVNAFIVKKGQPNDITGAFTERVVKAMFQTCCDLSQLRSDEPAPDLVVGMVKGCKGLPILEEKIRETRMRLESGILGGEGERDYEEELRIKQQELDKLDDQYFGVERKIQEEKIQELPERRIDLRVIQPSYQEFKSVDWKSFLPESLNYLITELEQKISTKKEQERLDVLKERSEPVFKTARAALEAALKKNPTIEVKPEVIKKLPEVKSKVIKKSPEEQAKYEESRAKIIRDINNITKELREAISRYEIRLPEDIAKVYWNVLSDALKIASIQEGLSTRKELRNIIVKAEGLNSEENACTNIPENLSNAKENCIVSALVNILLGIRKVKYEYHDIPLSSEEIDLAVEILIGKTKQVKLKSEQGPEFMLVEEDRDVDKVEQDAVVEIENPEERGNEELERFAQEEELREDEDYGDVLQEDIGDDLREEDFDVANSDVEAAFGMRSVDANRETLRQILEQVGEVDDGLLNHFISAVDDVKSSKVPNRVKTNRINFFATTIA